MLKDLNWTCNTMSVNVSRGEFVEVELDIVLKQLHPNKPEIARRIQSVLARLEAYTGMTFSLEHGPYLAGGCLRQAIEGNVCQTDYDIFFHDHKQYQMFLAQFTNPKRPSLAVVSKTLLAENFQLTTEEGVDLIQLIYGYKFYGSARYLLLDFDFTCCQLATDGTTLLMGPRTLDDILNRRLVFSGFNSLVNSVIRIGKYARYGYTITHEEVRTFLRNVANQPHAIEKKGGY